MHEEVALDEDSFCRFAVVTTRPADAEAVVARLEGCVANRARGFAAHIGGLSGHRVVVAAARSDPAAAVAALEALLFAHRPRLVVAGGICSGLSAPTKRGALVLASEVVAEAGHVLSINPGWSPEGVVVGRMLSIGRPVQSLEEKRTLAQQYRAVAIDRESYYLAKSCAEQEVPLLVMRVVTDGFDEEMPADVRFLLERKTVAGKAGAFTNTLFKNPSHLKHLWRQKESALEAAEILANWVVHLAKDLSHGNE